MILYKIIRYRDHKVYMRKINGQIVH